MYLRFVTDGYSTNYEMYGAQSESLVGLYDALRSAILEVTAEVVVLRRSTLAEMASLIEASHDTKPLESKVASAMAFATRATKVYIANDEKDPGTLLYIFPAGFGLFAIQTAEETVKFAKDMQSTYHIEPEGLERLNAFDVEFDVSILPHQLPLTAI